MQARLTILSGRRSGETVDLSPGENNIGTGRASEIQLRDKDVAFRHAKLVVEDGLVFLEDLKSSYGTFLKGERVEGRVPLSDRDEFRVGTAEMRVELTGAAAAAAAAPAPQPKVETKAEPKVETKAEPKVEPKAAPKVEPAPPPEPAPVAAPPPVVVDEGAIPDDPDQLKQLVRGLRRKLAEKAQEAAALEQALESVQKQKADAVSDATGYTSGAADDLLARIYELERAVQEEAAKVAQREDEIHALEKTRKELELRIEQAREGATSDTGKLEEELRRVHEKLEEWRGKVKQAEADVARFEEANSHLLLENEELKEKLAAAQWQLEQAAADRGALVRERIKELQADVHRLEQSNAELRTLVEAYEEKIDELDERVEELEGENEALEKLNDEVKAELDRTKTERDTMVKTLRQKLKRLEDKAAELEGDRARAQAAASRASEEPSPAGK